MRPVEPFCRASSIATSTPPTEHGDIRKHLTSTPTYNVLRSTHILEETLACGVTTARDMGEPTPGFAKQSPTDSSRARVS